MLAKERQDIIAELIKDNGAVTTAELMRRFKVSVETIRKDLMILEKGNFLKRVHGGAVTLKEMPKFLDLSGRNEENGDLKKELSETAVKFVHEGDIIGIDSGSTAIFFAHALKQSFKQLTVVTASTDIFDILCRHENFKLILCGGEFMKSENAFYGFLTCETLKKLHVSKAFIFSSAVSLKYGIADFSAELCEVQKHFIDCADKVFVLADSTKFEQSALIKVCDIDESYTYVTDTSLPSDLKKLYKENGINVITAEDIKND